MKEQYNHLVELVNSLGPEVDKADDGNGAAGTRGRKILQSIKTISQDLRVLIQQKKNEGK
jgi:hypothetical protein